VAIVNFYHREAIMKGTDYHTYMSFGPGIPLPLPEYPYMVLCVEKDGDKVVATVTSDAKNMIQRDNEVTGRDVSHKPRLEMPPHPLAQPQNEVGIILGASSQAVMGIASVTAEGQPLATCLEAAMGINKNCCDRRGRDNKVESVNSVRTNPTSARLPRRPRRQGQKMDQGGPRAGARHRSNHLGPAQSRLGQDEEGVGQIQGRDYESAEREEVTCRPHSFTRISWTITEAS
jgi:hypothetical protein